MVIFSNKSDTYDFNFLCQSLKFIINKHVYAINQDIIVIYNARGYTFKSFVVDRLLRRRKSKDYVYGIWVYKVLGIWEGYYRVKKSLVSCMKPWTEARNDKYMEYHSKLTYQLSFWNVSRKVDYHAGRKWFIHGPKRRKENQLLSLKHPCWLSLL